MRTSMAAPAPARGDVEPGYDERPFERRNPRQRRDHHSHHETTMDMDTRVLIRGSRRGQVVGETTPTRDRVRL
jgi:hypothetical protein